MNFPTFITIKDFLNYYIAGFIWLIDIGLILLPWTDLTKLHSELVKYQNLFTKFNDLVLALALLIIPYLLGFALTPIGMLMTRILRWIFGDPLRWVTDYKETSKWKLFFHKGRRLSRTNVDLVTKKLKWKLDEVQGIRKEKIDIWFFQIRAFVINQKGEAGALAIRAQDLFNLTESIYLPVPLPFFLVGVKMYGISTEIGWLFIVFGILFLILLSYRYLHLRTYWVKHIYRAFLADLGISSAVTERL